MSWQYLEPFMACIAMINWDLAVGAAEFDLDWNTLCQYLWHGQK